MPNGDDDDIEDELRRVANNLDELTRLLETMMMEGARQAEREEERPEGDLWDTGTTSPSASTMGQYKELRAEAASSTELVSPYLTGSQFDTFEERLEARYTLFQQGYDSLQSLYSGVSKEMFSAIVREFAKDYLAGEGEFVQAVADDLIEMLEPSYGTFGIRVVNDEVSVTQRLTPLDFLVVWGDFYHPLSQPWQSLRKERPEDIDELRGGKTVGEFNQELAINVFERRGMRLPQRYVDLLPQEMQAEWRERNE